MLIELREAGFSAEIDFLSRSVRAQMKLADKSKTRYVLLLGPDELKRDEVKLKDMQTSSEENIGIRDITSYLSKKKEDGE